MIQEFRCKETEKIWIGYHSSRFPAGMQKTALIKLLLLDTAKTLADLRVPPGNRLEALKGNRKDQHSIRINAQWRICFVWNNGLVRRVEIVDYH